MRFGSRPDEAGGTGVDFAVASRVTRLLVQVTGQIATLIRISIRGVEPAARPQAVIRLMHEGVERAVQT